MHFRLTVVSLALLFVNVVPAGTATRHQAATSIRADVDALNAAMVAAFKKDPAGVGAFYSDLAAIIGGGQRIQGRAGVDAYWKGATTFLGWSLETLATGGPADAPWQYGRSVLVGRGGQKMETYFVGLLRRTPSGELRFQVDAFARQRGEDGADDAGRVFGAYLEAVAKGDAGALSNLLDDQFVIVSANSARNKAEEIADLVPQAGNTVEYFRSDETRTQGFGAFAVISGVLNWKYGGREFQRNHSTIAVKRGAEWKILAQQVTPRA